MTRSKTKKAQRLWTKKSTTSYLKSPSIRARPKMVQLIKIDEFKKKKDLWPKKEGSRNLILDDLPSLFWMQLELCISDLGILWCLINLVASPFSHNIQLTLLSSWSCTCMDWIDVLLLCFTTNQPNQPSHVI